VRNPARTLYSQIAALYLLLLLAFSALAIAITARQLDSFLQEVEQRLNRNLAAQLARELEPALQSGLGSTDAERAVSRVRGINPGIDLYVLGEQGRVLASFTGKSAARRRIDIQPVRRFLARDAMLPILAGDPGDGDGDKVFSAAPLALPGERAFLYVILRGMPFETAASMLSTSYIVRGVGGVLSMVLLGTLAAGLILFAVLTRRFRRLTQVVRRFQEGAYDERADVEPHDQIGRLAAAFNEMAATIEVQVDALKRTDEARRALAANISHDFRTPLTSLRGYTERLSRADERLDPAERRQTLGAILKSATQLQHLADQLAAIVQLDVANHREAQFEAFSIAELVQDTAAKFAPAAERAGITLRIVSHEGVPPVKGDIALIERVISNLVDNSLDNTPAGGHIEISLPVEGDAVRVRVSDTGRGISADELARVTQRFFRTRESRSSGHAGTGLGLAIAQEIVMKHGGTLDIESRVGFGTTVSFRLDAAASGAGRPAQPPPVLT
jgi:two-component system, OmpR family, sensor kinase